MLERSEKYGKEMVRKCMAGPNALYLTEELTDSMEIETGSLVLDLGCGRGLSSVFIAKEFGAQVYAVDKNVHATETCAMLKDIGMDANVFPIQADASALPIPNGIIDTLVCINAYHNFGMEAGFFETKIKPVLKEDAQVGFVLLGRDKAFVYKDDDNENPVFWTADEWKTWFESEGVEVLLCEQLKSTQRAWKEWMTIASPDLTEEELEKTKINPELALIKLVGRA